jgi:hypothetical protein
LQAASAMHKATIGQIFDMFRIDGRGAGARAGVAAQRGGMASLGAAGSGEPNRR